MKRQRVKEIRDRGNEKQTKTKKKTEKTGGRTDKTDKQAYRLIYRQLKRDLL